MVCLLILTLSMFVAETSSQTVGCGSEWFGPQCQYKCHCTDNMCDNNGTCIKSSTCHLGWFGPACQYDDLSRVGTITASPGVVSLTPITDGNATTCINSNTVDTLTVTWARPYHFTWIRLEVNEPDSFKDIQIQFQESPNSARLNCSNQTTSVNHEKCADIFCLLDGTFQHVILSGAGVKSLCSVFISGGRNVALKQNTTQTSKHDTYTSDKAVDGDTNGDLNKGKSCTHTTYDDRKPTWDVIFSHPQAVDRFVVYNRQDCCMNRLKGFVLQSFSEGDVPLFSYTDQESTQPVYMVTPVSHMQSVSHVQISAMRQLNPSSNAYEIYLTLCEVEIYGDTICESGKFGLECEHSCNCAKNESCFVSTGGCPSGCAHGFYGPDCMKAIAQDTTYVIIIGSIIGILLFIALIVGVSVGIYLYREKSKSQGSLEIRVTDKKEGDDNPAHENHEKHSAELIGDGGIYVGDEDKAEEDGKGIETTKID